MMGSGSGGGVENLPPPGGSLTYSCSLGRERGRGEGREVVGREGGMEEGRREKRGEGRNERGDCDIIQFVSCTDHTQW